MKKFIIALFIAVPTYAMAHRGWGGPGRNYGYCFWDFGRGHMYGGGIFMWILWIVVLVALGFILYRIYNNRKELHSGTESGLDIAKRRYASGEINKEEYEELKKDLQS